MTAGTCTVARLNGAFCDRPAVPLAPFPICARHLVDAHLFVMEATRPSGRNDLDLTERIAQRARTQAEQSQVYYAREKDGRIKIGYSGNIRERFISLRLPLDALLATEPGGIDVEHLRHAQFKHLRQGRTESFDAGSDLLSHITMLVGHYGPPKVTTYPKTGRLD